VGDGLIVMVERYRSHLIFVKGYLDRTRRVWKASLHVQFNEDTQTFRDVYLPSPTGRFTGKTSAEKHGIKEARKWVDDRLRKVDLGVLVVFAQTSIFVPFICTTV
jgi:hypothetical protein